jgi:hypothetical protein
MQTNNKMKNEDAERLAFFILYCFRGANFLGFDSYGRGSLFFSGDRDFGSSFKSR